jgi:hypothetical protein
MPHPTVATKVRAPCVRPGQVARERLTVALVEVDGRVNNATRELALEESMGFYEDQVVPRVIELACGVTAVRPLRERVCAGLEGDVVELGFGSGHNVAFYPPTVRSVAAVEPSAVAWKRAQPRIDAGPPRSVAPAWTAGSCHSPTRASTPRCRRGRSAPFPTSARRCGSCAVSRPGAKLHFVEHGLAPDADVRRRQRRLEPLQKRLCGGCHLTRPIVDLLTAAGFAVADLDRFYEEGSPKFLGADVLGTARAG